MTSQADTTRADRAPTPRRERLAAIATALPAALAGNDRLADLADCLPVPLDVGGVAHDHLRLDGVARDGMPALARVPRLSQWRQPPSVQLAYEAAAFARAAPSGVTPRLFGVLSPEELPPNGALIVEYIAGRKARLPDDLSAIADCLAALHREPVPPAAAHVPLRTQTHPAAETLAVVEEQAVFMAEVELAAGTRRQIEAELTVLRELAHTAEAWPSLVALVGTDTHPGNYLIRDDGRAIFVDLEKAMFGMPAIDLAHATLYTSTMWDPDCAAALTGEAVDDFYARYLAATDPAIAAGLTRWRLPMRRLTWLRTLTWCIRWRALAARDPAWSPDAMPAAIRAHTEATVADFLSPETITRIRAEWV